MRKSHILIVLCLLAGCASLNSAELKSTAPLPPASMLVPAAEVPPMPRPVNMGTLANAYVDLLDMYGELAVRHKALAGYVSTVWGK